MPVTLASRETQLGETFSSYEFTIVDVTLEASYTTGGSPGFAAAVGEAAPGTTGPEGSGTGNIVAAIPLGGVTPAGSAQQFVCSYHLETDKLQVFQTGGAVSTPLSEVAAATNLSGYVYRFLVIARGT